MRGSEVGRDRTMGDAVIVSACRTAIGTARKGTLLDVSAFDLAKYAVAEALERSGVPAADVDDIVLGEVLQGGGDIARYAAIETGLVDVPGVAHNRHCASGMAAVQTAAGSIMAGMDTVVIAGGAESISTSPSSMKRVMGTDEMKPWMSPSHPETPRSARVRHVDHRRLEHRAEGRRHPRGDGPLGLRVAHAGRARDRRGSLRGGDLPDRRRAARRHHEDVLGRRAPARATTTMEKLASLKPLHPEIEGFSITAGNSSGLNDGSAAMVIVDGDYAKEHGLEPLAVDPLVGVGGRCRPKTPAWGRRYAIPKALKRAGLSIDDISLFEINEAFASMCVASTRVLGIPHEITNVNGSGCSLGHPVACTGARMIVTADPRAASPQRWLRRREHVRGRRHGLRDRDRGPQAVVPADAERLPRRLPLRQVAELAERDRQGGDVVGRLLHEVVEDAHRVHDPGMLRDPAVEPFVGRNAGRNQEHRGDEGPTLVREIVAQRGAGERVPSVVAGKVVEDPVAQPVETEAVSDRAPQRGDLDDRPAGREGNVDDVERAGERFESGDALGEGLGNSERGQVGAERRAPVALAATQESRHRGGTLDNPRLELGNRRRDR